MTVYDVYARYGVEPVSALGTRVTDREGQEYLDLYGGHAVISIGHAHPRFVAAVAGQLERLPFYSNSILNPLADRLAERLGEVSGYPEYDLFLCNSGAEAIENALKLASWKSGGTRVIAFENAFHGRTSLAVGATDNPKIRAPLNRCHDVVHLPLNDIGAFEAAVEEGTQGSSGSIAAVIVEGIQGIAGIFEPDDDFLQGVAQTCSEKGIPLILDEIQSGYGRTGDFFAHQSSGIRPDLITVAKGMGNGFPIGGVLISPDYPAERGALGTTFGGNHLACAAGLAVLDVMVEENLMENARKVGGELMDRLRAMPGITAVRGRGLMIGIDLDVPAAGVRSELLTTSHIFTGSASRPETIRLLPPLCLRPEEATHFTHHLHTTLLHDAA